MTTPRRNGQLASCEPCRKAKQRCDHKSPICDRCVARGRAAQCFYHPSPLTQLFQSQEKASKRIQRPKKRRPENQFVFRVNKSRDSAFTARDPTLNTSSHTASSLCEQYVAQWESPEKWPLTPGYLGVSAPKDIFNEQFDASSMGGQYLDGQSTDTSLVRSCTKGDFQKIQLGAQVLLQLNKIQWFQELIKVKNKIAPSWVLGGPLMDGLCIAIERLYNLAVQDSEDPEVQLLDLSKEIFTNTTKKIEVDRAMTISDYIPLIVARWDAIGVFFAMLTAASLNVPADNDIFTHSSPWKIDRDQLRSTSVAISEICCQFCHALGVTSDPFCWLVGQQTAHLTRMLGHTDYRTWQKLGDLSTVAYAASLLQPNGTVDDCCPFFLVEIRKRVLASGYAIDKELATALGRPARVSSRYFRIQLPLDLTHEQISGTPREIEMALQNIDSNGWNKQGKLTSEVKLRIAVLTSLTRESILELSLSHHIDGLQSRVDKMIEDARQIQQGLPPFLRWSSASGEVEDGSSIDESRLYTHVEFIYHEFLLYRTLWKRLSIKPQGLIESSCEIISTLLNLVMLRMRSGEKIHDLSWDLCYKGLPAAGILTAELRHSNQSPLSSHPRSWFIQKLSVF
ncbi:hypothetical protein BGW36DRAFT_259553, partial [Talaromyces proteolyticus]